tara:strand:- start:1675 stop:1863 length:189 start_codon:yes stop_codon:yes gene_type:complete
MKEDDMKTIMAIYSGIAMHALVTADRTLLNEPSELARQSVRMGSIMADELEQRFKKITEESK